MAFSQGCMEKLSQLGAAGHLPRGAKVLDFGSQNMYEEFTPEATRKFLSIFGREDHFKPELTVSGGKVDSLMQAAGFDYTAYDTYTAGCTRTFDLNVDSITEAERGTWDLVGNLGTSEHVANQYNVFKVAHEAMKVGGLTVNFLPFNGCYNHGLVNYHPKFFTTLIANNKYEPILWAFTDIFKGLLNQDNILAVEQADNGKIWEGYFVGSALMMVIYRKTRDAAYVPPTDAVLEGDVIVPFPTVNAIVQAIRRPMPGLY